MSDHAELMREAISLAKSALATDDVPVGALVLNQDGVVVGRSSNLRAVSYTHLTLPTIYSV